MRRPSIGSVAAAIAGAFIATGVTAQGLPPLTNYGPEPGFFSPQAAHDLQRGIVQAQRSLVHVAGPPVAPAPLALPQPVTPPQPVVAAPAPAAPLERIVDPTQGLAPAMNTHPLAQAVEATQAAQAVQAAQAAQAAVPADARAAEAARTEAQMDRIERLNELARQNPAPAGVNGAFDGLTDERNR
jgi:hypothetical protein